MSQINGKTPKNASKKVGPRTTTVFKTVICLSEAALAKICFGEKFGILIDVLLRIMVFFGRLLTNSSNTTLAVSQASRDKLGTWCNGCPVQTHAKIWHCLWGCPHSCPPMDLGYWPATEVHPSSNTEQLDYKAVSSVLGTLMQLLYTCPTAHSLNDKLW